MHIMCRLALLLYTFAAVQSLISAHSVEEQKGAEATTNESTTKSLVPDTPGVREYKNDLLEQLSSYLLDGKELSREQYVAEKSSDELDLPCTNDTVRIEVLSSSFPLPERFFHAPKRCSGEVD